MAITASMVKELRERTSAGMMECKKALSETDGDMEAAVQLLRTSGAAKADKKAGRVAAEGVVSIYISDDRKLGVIVEVNSETDFVAKGDDFQKFAADIAAVVAATNPADIDALNATKLSSGETVDEARRALIAKLGENITVRRFERIEAEGDAVVSSYQHGLKIGVLVESVGGNKDLGKDTSILTNYDWYSPSQAFRYTKQEFLDWIEQESLDKVHFHSEQACYSGRFKKRG